MKLIDCDLEHSAAIMAIFNDAILNSTALYEYRPRTEAVIEEWFAAKRRGGYPVIGVVDDEDRLMGFASYGAFRAFPAYKYRRALAVHQRAVSRSRPRKIVARVADSASSR
jgi:L-amino acid N-acyltransferase